MRQAEVLHLLGIAIYRNGFKVKKIIFRKLENYDVIYKENMMTAIDLGHVSIILRIG